MIILTVLVPGPLCKKLKVKVSCSLVTVAAIWAVDVRGQPYGGHSISKAEPIQLLLCVVILA